MSLPTVIQAKLDGRTVRVAPLVEFCFKTQPRRVWPGRYTLNAGGHDWFGLNKLGAGMEIADPGDLEASEMKFFVSGVDERFLELFTLAAAESREEYVGRHVRVYEQYFDDDWQKLDEPQAVTAGIMDSIGIDSYQIEVDGVEYTQRIISITAQNIFHGRSGTSVDFWTNQSQQRRSPGDRGLEYRSQLIEVNIETPW